jgi:hypothetical protein
MHSGKPPYLANPPSPHEPDSRNGVQLLKPLGKNGDESLQLVKLEAGQVATHRDASARAVTFIPVTGFQNDS